MTADGERAGLAGCPEKGYSQPLKAERFCSAEIGTHFEAAGENRHQPESAKKSLHAFFYHPRTLKCFGGRGVPRGRLNSRGRLNDLGAGGYLADA